MCDLLTASATLARMEIEMVTCYKLIIPLKSGEGKPWRAVDTVPGGACEATCKCGCTHHVIIYCSLYSQSLDVTLAFFYFTYTSLSYNHQLLLNVTMN